MDLDLGVLAQKTLNIKLPTGEMINVKRPNKALLKEVSTVDVKLGKAKDFNSMVDEVEKIVVKVLSNNSNGIKFTAETLEEKEIDYSMQQAIFRAYMSFIVTLANNPN